MPTWELLSAQRHALLKLPFCVFFFQSAMRQYCFVPFATVCLLSALYVALVLPETKGKSLSAITGEFHKLNFKNKEGAHSGQIQYQPGEVCTSTAL